MGKIQREKSVKELLITQKIIMNQLEYDSLDTETKELADKMFLKALTKNSIEEYFDYIRIVSLEDIIKNFNSDETRIINVLTN